MRKLFISSLLVLSALFSNINSYASPNVIPTDIYSPQGYIVIIDSGRTLIIKTGSNLLVTIKDERGKEVFRKPEMNAGDREYVPLPPGKYKLYVNNNNNNKEDFEFTVSE